IIFGFNLDRKPNEKENREAWDKLLRKQADYVMNLPVALEVGNEPALAVQSPKPFQFYIAKRGTVWLTLAVALIVFVVAYFLLIKNPTALRDSKGGYYSLGKSQMAFWGLLVLLTFASIWILTGTMERIPDQVLILLGISGATGLSAMMIGENNKSTAKTKRETRLNELRTECKKIEEEKKTSGQNFPKVSQDRLGEIDKEIAELTKVSKSDTPKFWSDICDDGNGMSFHRLQVVVWTIILGVVFVSTVAHVISMPEFSETLLILMGISNGTYLGFKIPEKPGT
ncbi:MAG: hypothetical protein L0Z73_13350, partial [Gammaproteobacteria bacterium]|nr:hypothetical protein [Gammaproteobacteria bacterium]